LEEEQARLDSMIEEFRVARQRRLEQQGIALRNRAKTQQNAVVKAEPPPAKVN